MFSNSQEAADMLKGMIGRNKRAMEAVKRLEKCGWHGGAFADACQETGARLDENGFSFSVDVAHSVETLIHAYLAKMDCEVDLFADIFDVKSAAAYLGISENSMKQYAHRDKKIVGKLVGKSMIFHRQQLDAFRRTMKPAGNPNWVKEG